VEVSLFILLTIPTINVFAPTFLPTAVAVWLSIISDACSPSSAIALSKLDLFTTVKYFLFFIL